MSVNLKMNRCGLLNVRNAWFGRQVGVVRHDSLFVQWGVEGRNNNFKKLLKKKKKEKIYGQYPVIKMVQTPWYDLKPSTIGNL